MQNRKQPRKTLQRILIPTLIALITGGYFYQRNGIASTAPTLETVQVRRETLDRAVTATGVVRPMVGAEIDVGSRISGIVQSIPVEIGDKVHSGDLLARIDPTELQAELAQAQADLTLAQAQLANARTTHTRAKALATDGIVSDTELDSAARDLEVAKARVDLEQARVSSAAIRLGYTEIRAPIRGVIANVTTREGETVAASFASPTFVSIIDLDRLEVQAYVDETDIGRIFLGQPASFTVDTYPDAEFTARVTAINPKAELQNGVVNYIVLLSFDPQPDHILRPEMTAHVRLQVEQRPDVLTLPRKAIRRDQGRSFVTVLRDDRWVDQQIQPGWRTDRRIEIQQGLAEGETVQLNAE
jgi:RND family efflux transporter MFP subunit